MLREEVNRITDYIFISSKLEHSDLALVFGTRNIEAAKKAAKLYKDGYIPKIIVSGGVNRVTGVNEAEELAGKMIELGVSEKDIMRESNSTNTLENVLFSKALIDQKLGLKNIKKLIVVVKHYHARRVLMTLKKHLPSSIKIIPATYDVYDFNSSNWRESELGRNKVLSEVSKIKEYLAKGDIEELG